ncbi:hypothetical protein GEMRC1_008288 [Eukaryota sp. GEM-RC1]
MELNFYNTFVLSEYLILLSFLDSSKLRYVEFDSDIQVFIDSVYLTNTSSVITDAILHVGHFHWLEGEFFPPGNISLKILVLYGDSKTWFQNSLIIEEELHFNNSLTFSISRLILITVSVTCFPGSELLLDSHSFDESLLEVKIHLHLTSNCSLTSLSPVQSTGIITLTNHSVLTLLNDFSSSGVLEIYYDGELVLKNTTITFNGSLYLHEELFLYYNWITSSNQIDYSMNHDNNTIIIDGPEWKTDDIGGYLDITPGNTLHIPNIPGEFGWRDASIPLWIYFEEGGMGFWGQSPCILYLTTNLIWWGDYYLIHIKFPLKEWFHLVITFDQSEVYFTLMESFCIHFNQILHITDAPQKFRGKIRAVQIFTKTLTVSEINQLTIELPTYVWGQGKVPLLNSNVEFLSSKFFIRSLSLTSSKLQANNVVFRDLDQLELYIESRMNLSQNAKIYSDRLSITLNSSKLFYDDSVNISTSIISLIAFKSHFQNDFEFDTIQILNLSLSNFQSTSSTGIAVGHFSCDHCQILGNSTLVIETNSEINSGNFASSFIVQESADNNWITGQVQLAKSMDFFSHVILDDVSVSELQSSIGSITCHSDVLMRNDVSISVVSFVFNDTLILIDSTFLLDMMLVIYDSQTITGFGTIVSNFLNFGRLRPDSIIAFEDVVFLSLSSIVSFQINNDSCYTQLAVNSTVYLDGILEVEFDSNFQSTDANFTLIRSNQIIGKFSHITSRCASVLTTFYSDTSLSVSLNDIVLDLNQVSYISSSGVDDPCCGTFDSPCASFKGVLERMGRKGKVYFHSGYSFFNQGFGKLFDVNWEVTGLGDVIIDGIDLVFLDAVSSSLTIQNLKFYGNNVLLKFVIHQSILIL